MCPAVLPTFFVEFSQGIPCRQTVCLRTIGNLEEAFHRHRIIFRHAVSSGFAIGLLCPFLCPPRQAGGHLNGAELLGVGGMRVAFQHPERGPSSGLLHDARRDPLGSHERRACVAQRVMAGVINPKTPHQSAKRLGHGRLLPGGPHGGSHQTHAHCDDLPSTAPSTQQHEPMR